MLSALGRRRAPYRRRKMRGYAGGEVRTVTFPSSQLITRAHIALGADLTASYLTWNWLDVTDRVRHDLGITVDFGRRDESTRVNPSKCQLKLTNDDGWFSRLNPHSPYFGLLGGKVANTPIWIELDAGAGFVDRYFGYVNEWPVEWTDPSAEDSYVVIQCAGVFRRLAQGENVDSSLNRTILADEPVHFWRMDDPAGSPVFFSSMPNGGIHMVPDAGVAFAEIDSPPGGDGATSAASFDDSVAARAANLNVAPPFTVEWAVRRPPDGSADGGQVFAFTYVVDGVESNFQAAVIEDTAVSEREWYHFMVQASQVGANWEMYWWKNGLSQGLATSGAGTLARVDAVRPGLSPEVTNELSLGYVAVYAHHNVDAQAHSDALQAFAGEQAHVRMARVAAQIGVSFTCQAAESAPLGPQEPGTPLEVFRDAEKTDGGVLYEDKYGVGYQALSERYNASVVFELDFDQWHIYSVPKAADDDQRFRNQWTVRSSSTGASRTWRDPDYAATDGLYDDGDTINPETDDQLLYAASWFVRRDTVVEYRWPRMPINLGGTPELITGWTSTPFGARVTVANPPAQVAPDLIDSILEGYTERWDSVSWAANLNLSPASIYQVGVAGDTTTAGSWAQTTDAVLAEDLDTTETAIDVTSTDDWTNASPAGEPLVFGGEVVALDAVSGSAPNWTFTVRRSQNGAVKSHSAGAPVRVHRPLVAAY